MATNVSLDTPAHPSKDSPAYPGRDRRKPTHYDRSESADNKAPTDRERFVLANSTVTLERGPAGPVARVERDGVTDYAGPLPRATIDALREVSR